MNPLKSNEHAGIIDVQMVDEIFFMVPAILNIHERFLDELKRRLDAWEPLQKVGDAFIEAVSDSYFQINQICNEKFYYFVVFKDNGPRNIHIIC